MVGRGADLEYGGEAGVRAATLFWPGSEAAIGGRRPSEWRKYDENLPPDERVQTVLDWLAQPEATRPRLITMYFHEADTAGHRFGVDSEEVREAVLLVDRSMGKLVAGVRQLGLAECDEFCGGVGSWDDGAESGAGGGVEFAGGFEIGAGGFLGAGGGAASARGTAEELYAKLKAGAEHYQGVPAGGGAGAIAFPRE